MQYLQCTCEQGALCWLSAEVTLYNLSIVTDDADLYDLGDGGVGVFPDDLPTTYYITAGIVSDPRNLGVKQKVFPSRLEHQVWLSE